MTSQPAANTPAPSSASDPADGLGARIRPSRRSLVSGISLLVICGLVALGMFTPVPYVIEQPGPAIDVLGSYQDQRILTVAGHETYPTSGSLMMTTVSVDGGPGYTVTPAEVVRSWFDPTRSVLPRELVFPKGATQQETGLQNTADMISSQQDAVAVALTSLHLPVTPDVIVAGVLDGGPAQGVLKAGDVVVSVDGQTRGTVEEYQQLTASRTPGTPVAMVVRRDGAETTLSVPTEAIGGAARMGISFARGYESPVDVRISLADVGGPSAGTMFSLAVYDELTPGALTGGQKIAGTGTMDPEGEVGPIGGIRQKMVGARDAGADYFLAPAQNCDEVQGHIPEGLAVVRVSTFDDALHATESIAAQKSAKGLPTCSS